MLSRSLALLAPIAVVSCVTVNITSRRQLSKKLPTKSSWMCGTNRAAIPRQVKKTKPYLPPRVKKPNKARLTRVTSSSPH